MIPLKYTWNSLGRRKLTTGITIMGVALVVFVFAAVLMMAFGIRKTLQSTGLPDNVKILRKSSTAEISSIIPGEDQALIAALPQIAKDTDGKPLTSNEPVVVINLTRNDGATGNITVRGVGPNYGKLHSQVKIIKGRNYHFGLNELIVGEAIVKEFPEAKVGEKIKFAGNEWEIVGEFTTDGSGYDSELWGDGIRLGSAFNRGTTVSTITAKLKAAAEVDALNHSLVKDKRLNAYEAKPEQAYYEEQSEFLSSFIEILGIFVTVIFSFGAMIGATITMYAAVANRTVEIGTLRALGFSRRSVMAAFLMESLLLSLLGGLFGLVLASFLSFVQVSTINFESYSQLSFSFALSPEIVITSLIFSLIMGFVGGFLPSFRAARLNIVNSLRGG